MIDEPVETISLRQLQIAAKPGDTDVVPVPKARTVALPHNADVIIERVDSRRSDSGNQKRNISDFKKFGRREPDKIRRKPPDGIGNAPLVEHDG